MFTEVIVEFNKRLDTLQAGIDRVAHLVMELFNQSYPAGSHKSDVQKSLITFTS